MSDYAALFAAAEAAHGLPLGILAAVAAQESSGNTWAIRFEPAFYARYLDGKDTKDLAGLWPSGVTVATERMARATSFGLLQVMGQVARERGFAGTYLSQLCDPATGIEFGARHLKAKIVAFGSLERALSAYNAGSPTAANVASYVEPILTRQAAGVAGVAVRTGPDVA